MFSCFYDINLAMSVGLFVALPHRTSLMSSWNPDLFHVKWCSSSSVIVRLPPESMVKPFTSSDLDSLHTMIVCMHCQLLLYVTVNTSLCNVIIIINPLTARVVGAPQMILQPVSPFSPVLHCPLRLADLQACPFPDVVFPPLPLFALSSSPFHSALQDGFGHTWWTGNMTIPLQFASLYDRQEIFVWSNCLLDLGTDFLVGNRVFVWDG